MRTRIGLAQPMNTLPARHQVRAVTVAKPEQGRSAPHHDQANRTRRKTGLTTALGRAAGFMS